MDKITFGVEPGPEWKRVAKALATIEKFIPVSTRRVLSSASDEAAREAAVAVMNVQISTPGAASKAKKRSRGTRARIARGVAVRPAGSGFQIITAMPVGEGMLPRGFMSHWVRPVFGGPSSVMSVSNEDWFIEPIARNRPEITRSLKNVLDDAADKVAKAGGNRI